MKNKALMILLAGLFVSGSVVAADWAETLKITDEPFTNVGRNAYFILEPGYQLTLSGKEDGKQTTLIIKVLEETMDINGVSTRVVEERESADGKLVEVSRNYFAVGTKTKNVYYFGEDVDMYKGDGKMTHEGSWRAGRGRARHGIMIPGAVTVGDRYYQEYAPELAMDRGENVSIKEKVKTASGEFTQCLKVKETTPLESGTEYKLYAPEVGLVQEGHLKLTQYSSVKK
jgi:hypothetical protein